MVTHDNHSAHQVEVDLQTLLAHCPELSVIGFPDWETLPYDQFSPDPNIVSQRLATLHRLPSLARGIVVVPVQTLMQQLAPLSYIVGGSFDFKVGQRLVLDAEKQRLERAGYRNVPQVMDPGDFTVRGGCLMFIRWVRMYRCESNYWMRRLIQSACSIPNRSVR